MISIGKRLLHTKKAFCDSIFYSNDRQLLGFGEQLNLSLLIFKNLAYLIFDSRFKKQGLDRLKHSLKFAFQEIAEHTQN